MGAGKGAVKSVECSKTMLGLADLDDAFLCDLVRTFIILSDRFVD